MSISMLSQKVILQFPIAYPLNQYILLFTGYSFIVESTQSYLSLTIND